MKGVSGYEEGGGGGWFGVDRTKDVQLGGYYQNNTFINGARERSHVGIDKFYMFVHCLYVRTLRSCMFVHCVHLIIQLPNCQQSYKQNSLNTRYKTATGKVENIQT